MNIIPEKLKGTEFEKLLKEASAKASKKGLLTMDHYGVTLSVQNGKSMGIQSKPDYDGVVNGGRQFIIEAKVCSGPSFELRVDKIKPRQISFMLSRSALGVPCYLMIHWCARKLVKSSNPAMTVAIRVSDAYPRWLKFVDAYNYAKKESKRLGVKVLMEPQGSISRDESLSIGEVVLWEVPIRCRKALPDLVSLLMKPENKSFRDRMQDEYRELSDRINKLDLFITSNSIYERLPDVEQLRLQRQLKAMMSYEIALEERLGATSTSDAS